MKKELQGLEEGPNMVIHLDLLRVKLKKVHTGNHRGTMEYIDSGSKKSLASTID